MTLTTHTSRWHVVLYYQFNSLPGQSSPTRESIQRSSESSDRRAFCSGSGLDFSYAGNYHDGDENEDYGDFGDENEDYGDNGDENEDYGKDGDENDDYGDFGDDNDGEGRFLMDVPFVPAQGSIIHMQEIVFMIIVWRLND